MAPDRHSMTEMHVSTDDATGDPTPLGYVPIADGVGGISWDPGTVAGGFELRDEGGQSDIFAHGSMGTTENLDPSDGNVHTGTLNANCTATLLQPSGSGAATIEFWVTQDGTGGRELTMAASGGSFTWDGGTPSPDTTAGVTVRYVFERIPGTTNDWIGNLVGGAATGSADNAVGPILISDTHSTPLVFDDLLQTEEGDDLLYLDP